MPDHVHMLLAIPLKYAVAQVMGFLKGKSAIHIARGWGGRKHQYVGQHFWARGYWVSTVGRDEAAVRVYIAEQEKEAQRLDQLELFEGARRFERFIISSLRLCRRSLTSPALSFHSRSRPFKAVGKNQSPQVGPDSQAQHQHAQVKKDPGDD